MEKFISFQYVQPTDDQVALMQGYRDQYEYLYRLILQLPNSRGKSIAITKLEESAFWLNKGITHND